MSPTYDLRLFQHFQVLIRDHNHCRSCGRQLPLNSSWVVCPFSHSHHVLTPEAVLSQWCLRVRDWYLDWHRSGGGGWVKTRSRAPITIPPLRISNASPEQRYFWELAWIFKDGCEMSLINLARWLQRLWFLLPVPNQHLVQIQRVEEFRFWPGGYYAVNHCAFLFTLTDISRPGGRQQFIFDPTGIQFGPHWALLSPFGEYLRKHVRPEWDELAIRSLGFAAWLDEEGEDLDEWYRMPLQYV